VKTIIANALDREVAAEAKNAFELLLCLTNFLATLSALVDHLNDVEAIQRESDGCEGPVGTLSGGCHRSGNEKRQRENDVVYPPLE